MIPDFAGKVIEQAKIDYGLHLRTADGWMIVAEGTVLLGDASGEQAEVAVAVAESPLPDELDVVVGQTIGRLVVADDGHLTVQIGDHRLTVLADERYEAWHITGPDGELLICTPGGELAYFAPVRHDGETGTSEADSSEPTPTGGSSCGP